jgi:hypothetical protein
LKNLDANVKDVQIRKARKKFHGCDAMESGGEVPEPPACSALSG